MAGSRLSDLLHVIIVSICLWKGRSFADRLLADFDWGLTKMSGYPEIRFNDTSDDSEVVFKYNYAGNLSDSKFLRVDLRAKDCIQKADNTSLSFQMNTTNNMLTVDININQDTISKSKLYTASADGLSAKIDFCVRLDYMYVNPDNEAESINFQETSVDIYVDLTANFTLATVNVTREGASQDNSSASLDYAVDAYFCVDDNDEVNAPIFVQGDALQFCVKISDTVTTKNVFVNDILEFELTQDGGTAPASKPIVNTQPDPLTTKECREGGICNVKTQLTAKWFSEVFPRPLQIGGVAILSFGKASMMPSAAPGPVSGRRLRVPVRGMINEEQLRLLQRRELQETTAPVAAAGQTTQPAAASGTTAPGGATTAPGGASGQTTAPNAAAGATTAPNAAGATTAPNAAGATTAPGGVSSTTAPSGGENATGSLFDDAAYDDFASTGGTGAPIATDPPGFLGGASAAFGDLEASLANNVNKTVTKFCDTCNLPSPGILAAIILCVIISIVLTLLFCLCPSKTVKKTIEETTIHHEHDHNQQAPPMPGYPQPQPIIIPFQSHAPAPLPPLPPPPAAAGPPVILPPPPFVPQSPHPQRSVYEPPHFTFNMIHPSPTPGSPRGSIYARRQSLGAASSAYSYHPSVAAGSMYSRRQHSVRSLHDRSVHDLYSDEISGVLGLPDIID